MRKTILLLSIMLFIINSLPSIVCGETSKIRFGIQASRNIAKSKAKWQAFGNYVGQELGVAVEIIPVKPDQTVNYITSGKLDYMISNPILAVILNEKHGTVPLLSLHSKSGLKFAGVIISKKGKNITKGTDLKGKKGMAYKFKNSAAAYVFQMYHLKQQGIDPHKDFALFKEAKSQDDIVLAVKAGIIDVGFIKSGLLESMEKEGKIKRDDFDIVDQKTDEYPLLHSTELYPNWYLNATSKMAAELNEKLVSALVKIKESDLAAKKAKIIGFAPPLDLDAIKIVLKELMLPPYNISN